MESDRCDQCRFWRRTEGDAGECHRRAPSWPPVLPSAWTLQMRWPPMPAGEWCGEWQPLPLQQEDEHLRACCARRRELEEHVAAQLDDLHEALALWRQDHPGHVTTWQGAVRWLIDERRRLSDEVARLSRAIVDGEGDEED